MNRKIGEVVAALKKIDDESTDEDLLERLGYSGTVDSFKKEVEEWGEKRS